MGTSEPKRSKAEQGARTREALIQAAIRQLSEHGYAGTSLKMIARDAGISHGVIPFHFGSKEGLLQAVVERCFDAFEEEIFGALRARQREYGVHDLAQLMEASLRFARKRPDIGRLFLILQVEAMGESSELRPLFNAFFARMRGLGQLWVREGIERGVLRQDLDVDATIDMVIAFLTGARLHMFLVEDFPRERVNQALISALRYGLISDPRGQGHTP